MLSPILSSAGSVAFVNGQTRPPGVQLIFFLGTTPSVHLDDQVFLSLLSLSVCLSLSLSGLRASHGAQVCPIDFFTNTYIESCPCPMPGRFKVSI